MPSGSQITCLTWCLLPPNYRKKTMVSSGMAFVMQSTASMLFSLTLWVPVTAASLAATRSIWRSMWPACVWRFVIPIGKDIHVPCEGRNLTQIWHSFLNNTIAASTKPLLEGLYVVLSLDAHRVTHLKDVLTREFYKFLLRVQNIHQVVSFFIC